MNSNYDMLQYMDLYTIYAYTYCCGIFWNVYVSKWVYVYIQYIFIMLVVY